MIFRINAKILTKTGRNEIIKEKDGSWKIKVTVAPTKGKANEKVIELIAEEFKVPKSNVTIVKGLRASLKTIDVELQK